MATKILAIDDSKTMRLAIKITFAAEDAEVTSVSKGSDAVARIKAKQGGYDVVLVDAKLAAGEPSGYDVCRAIKQDPATAKIPVIVLVSNQTGVDQDQLTAAGGDDFIAKPFDSQEVIDKVAGVQSKPAARPSSGASPVAEAPAVAPAVAPAAAPAAAPAPTPRAATGPRPAVAATPPTSTPPVRTQRAVNRTQMGMPAPAVAAASAAKPAVAKPVVAKPAAAKPAAAKPAMARPPATGRPSSGAVTAVPPSRPATPAPPVRSAVAAPSSPAAAAPKPAAAMARPASGPARAAASASTGGADAKIPIAIPIPFTAADSPTPGMVERLQQAAGAGGVDPKVAEALASLSRDVIERVVWEVVPELAEAIIREQQAKSA